MRLTQISVFLANSLGRLESVCKVLADAAVNINTITILESGEYGIVRMIVDKPSEACAALQAGGFSCKEVEVLAVEVSDTPGALYKLLKKTKDAGVNLEYMYAMTKPAGQNPLMIMSFKDIDAAEKLLG
ncbi:MAG: amino acid-binding protein [Opitutales bacterium]|nr:amino acid-binding protein [Opitutales bacterium]